MYQFIETIRIENGGPSLLPLHQQRMDRTLNECFGINESVSLFDHLALLSLPQNGIWKCRVTYQTQIEKIEFEPYQKRAIGSLKIIAADHLQYKHKYADRSELNKLFALKATADDILIIKNKLLTDTSYCNIALWDGRNWFTPLHPLLQGIRRASLIEQQIIQPIHILVTDLPSFRTIKLFNAMISFDEATEISIDSILS